MPAHTDPGYPRATHPFAFTVLFLPYGMVGGYCTVTLTYLLAHAGVGVEQIATLVALSLLPQTWKVIWAPLIDTTLSARHWYGASTLASALSVVAIALIPAPQKSLWLVDLLVLVTSISCSFSAIATEMVMAHGTADHQRGRAGGWSQAGNLGGSGLGGGLALWMSQHAAPWSGGVLLGAICLACPLALKFAAQPDRSHRAQVPYRATLLAVGRDVWSITRTRTGLLTGLLFLLPIGTAAASGLWPAVAGDWHANADTVALVNGAAGGVLSMLGCVAAGYACDVIDRKSSYLLFGILQAACALAMAVCARTVTTFVVLTCVYAVISGFIWAAFSAVALESIGRRSVATNYNLMTCISNVPIVYMTTIEGRAQVRWGSSGMLYTEATLAVLALAVFTAAAWISRPRKATPAGSAA
ncbi:MAG TPA: MFS transporter [Steroidobacteraceae bacterium]|nr:MFS transporter [Steroidobacteraceae bacterium]